MEKPPTIREIFAAAIKIEPEEERSRYLDEACDGDAAMRAEIDGLIQAHHDAGSFFTDGNEEIFGGTVATGHKETHLGTQIGPYKLLQQIGEGGMGSVWMAEQDKPVRRMVALKIIKAGMDSKQVIARFEAERQALALMSHPNIANVLDAGTTKSGRPFFVMELVKGVPITQFCDKYKYTSQQRLTLFMDVCRAVQHAHQKGVIHRDIKPSNVMVTLHDGVPVVKIIDFGLAKATSQKLTERTLFTAYGQMVGTPAYMSPEQAEMSGLDVDTRTDIYSLGVLLYELMTGTTPIDAKSLREAGFAEMQRMILHEEAPPMSTRMNFLEGQSIVIAGHRGSDPKRLSQLFRGDLDVIVAKSLDKDRSRRYTTSSEFADDVRHFLNNEAIAARPASTTYRLQKLYHRNKLVLLTAAALVSVLMLATAFSSTQAIRAYHAVKKLDEEKGKTLIALRKAESAEEAQRQLRIEAEASESIAAANSYISDMNNVATCASRWDWGRANSLLNRHARGSRSDEFRGFAWHYWKRQFTQFQRELSAQGEVMFIPDEETLLIGQDDYSIASVDVHTGVLQNEFAGHQQRPRSLAVSSSLKSIAAGSGNKIVLVWDRKTKKLLHRFTGNGLPVHSVRFIDKQNKLAAICGSYLHVWDLDNGELDKTLTLSDVNPAYAPEDKAGISPNGAFAYYRCRLSNKMSVVDINDETELWSVDNNGGGLDPGFSPDSKNLMISFYNLSIDRYDVATGELRSSIRDDRKTYCLTVSRDENVLVTGRVDGVIKLWNLESEQLIGTLVGHDTLITSLSLSSSGQILASKSADGSVKIWNVSLVKPDPLAVERIDGIWAPEFSGDGRFVGFVQDNCVRIFDRSNGSADPIRQLGRHNSRVVALTFSSRSNYVASRDEAGETIVWNLRNGMGVKLDAQPDNGEKASFAFSPDERLLVVSTGLTVAICDVDSGRVIDEINRQGYARFTPDGKKIVIANHSFGTVRNVVSVVSAKKPYALLEAYKETHPSRYFVHYMVISPDGKSVYTANSDGSIRIWDISTSPKKNSIRMRGSAATRYRLAVASDGRTLASVCRRGVTLWNLTCNEQSTFAELPNLSRVSFSPNGKTILAGTNDCTYRMSIDDKMNKFRSLGVANRKDSSGMRPDQKPAFRRRE